MRITKWLKGDGKRISGTRIFYASDFHGSTTTFKKFLNATSYFAEKGHIIDILLMGGDLAGKLIVPIIQEGGQYHTFLTGSERSITKQDALSSFQRDCETLGIYPHIFTSEEYDRFSNDANDQDRLFKQLILKRLGEWIDLAEQRLQGKEVHCYLMPGNDDIAEVDSILEGRTAVTNPDGKVVRIDDEHEMISLGAANMTPFNCPRDTSEKELKKRIDELAAKVEDMPRCIFNIHVPPFNTGIDEAPELDENLRPQIGAKGVEMVPVGSTSVREAIEEYQPLLALHGHIHESRGVTRIGRTLCINPGSEYSEGILRGAFVTVRGDKVISHILTSG